MPEDQKASLFDQFLDRKLEEAGFQPGALRLHRSPDGQELVAGRRLRNSETVYPGTASSRMSEASGGSKRRSWARAALAGLGASASAYDALLPLALTLATHLEEGPSSSWWPFVQLLPDSSELVHVTEWRRLAVARKLGNAGDTLLGMDGTVARLAALLYQTGSQSSHLQGLRAARAFALVASRAVTCRELPVLNPAIALMNHAGHSANVAVDREDCSMRTLREVAEGEPIRVHYGSRPCLSWIQTYGFVPPDEEDPGSERLFLMLPPLKLAADASGEYAAEDLQSFASRLRAADKRLRCSDGFTLPPAPGSYQQPDIVDETQAEDGEANESSLEFLVADVEFRYPRCWWLRVLSESWWRLLPYSPNLLRNSSADELEDPWKDVAGKWMPNSLLDQAESFAQGAENPEPWPEPTARQSSWWRDVQRCFARQARVLHSWADRFRQM